jgi:hypothetical protein
LLQAGQRRRTTNQDERIGDQRRPTQLCQIPDHCQGHEQDKLGKDEPFGLDKDAALGDGENERLEILRNEDGVC